MRIIVHTGKGGVGKTSVSAATALRCADLGYRTLVLSTDTAHSLGDAFQVTLGPEPIAITDNLDAQEIDVHYSINKYWGAFQKFMVTLFTRRGAEDVIAEEVAILPGLEEGASLLWLNEYVERAAYDVIVVDAAPTAETLRLLSLPDVARWWVERFLPVAQLAARFLSPVGRAVGINAPDHEAIDTFEKLFEALDAARGLLSDPALSSMRLVVNAERMVVKETQRTYTYLNLYGYPVDSIICNRLIPDTVTDPYFQGWKDTQRDNLQLIEECFGTLPLLSVPLYSREMGGLELLRQMGETLFQGRDPSGQLSTGQGQTLHQEQDGGYTLRVPVGLADKSEVDLYRGPDEITVKIGAFRRNIILPHPLWPLAVNSATVRDGMLVLRFAAPE